MATKKKKMKTEIYSVSVIAMLSLSLLAIFAVPATADSNWLSGWEYRKPVTISSQGDSLLNYQVLVTTDTESLISAGKMNSYGDDIRFTESDGTTEIDYWIEGEINTDSTMIWVEVASIPTEGTTIYMYYGNSGASSATDGAATFVFFDDFDDADNWEYQRFYSFGNSDTNFIALDGKLKITSGVNNRVGPTTTETHLSQGQKFEAKMVTRTNLAETNQLIYISEGNTYENDCYNTVPINTHAVWRAFGGDVTNPWQGDEGTGDDVISYPYIEYRTTNHVHFGTREKNEVYEEESPWASDTTFKLAFYACSPGTIEIDWTFVREYASPEPGVSIGSEGTPSSPSYPSATSSTGSFTVENSVPEVIDFTLYDANEIQEITEMTPQAEYALKIDVADANKITDISEIDVILKKHDIQSTDEDSVTNKATYRWTPSLGWELVGPAGSTWDINVSACKHPPSLSTTTGTWWLRFTPGKVAIEFDWDICVKVKDMQPTPTLSTKEIYVMLWYGEISTVDSSYSFGDVDLDAENMVITDADRAVNVTTTANGNYTLESKSENWVNETYGSTATLDWDGTLDASHFALKVDGAETVDTFNYVNTSYITITDFSSVTGPTAEGGENRGIYQWLCVASSGLLPGTYGGTYFVQIANG